MIIASTISKIWQCPFNTGKVFEIYLTLIKRIMFIWEFSVSIQIYNIAFVLRYSKPVFLLMEGFAFWNCYRFQALLISALSHRCQGLTNTNTCRKDYCSFYKSCILACSLTPWKIVLLLILWFYIFGHCLYSLLTMFVSI